MVCGLHICLCTICMPETHRGQKGALGPLGLALKMVVNHHVGAGNWTQVLCESSQCGFTGTCVGKRVMHMK